MKDNYLILRYFISCPFVCDSANAVYEKYYPQFAPGKREKRDPRNRILSADEAKELIRKNGMVKVADNVYGQIWKVPDIK